MKWIIFSLVSMVTIPVMAQESIVGNWDLGRDNTIIEIYQTGDFWEAKVISSDHKRMKPGTLMLKDLIYDDEEWNGQFYIPKLKSWAKATLVIEGESIRMIVKKSLMKKKIILIKVDL